MERNDERTQKPAGSPEEAHDAELSDDDLEQASGGVIDGGCIPNPWEPTDPWDPTKPIGPWIETR